ncbi:MAG: hypothetical protein QOI46_2252 [Alphaproteobacteria bacterium]|jgi:hypothetical protein|nr:hypothetical protein [Alphaproteobacteria bacterium]
MTKSTTRLPLTIALQIPTCWTAEQAFAVFQLVDDLREAIWQCYSLQIHDQYRDQLQPLPADRDDKNIGDPPF